MISFFLQHQFWAAAALYWIFSAAVSAMPDADGKSSPVYLWFYRFIHTVAGNITTAFGGRIPNLKPNLKPFIPPMVLLPLLVTAAACAAYTIHPGAINTADSAAYDTLLVAQATIQQARQDYEAGLLPVSKDQIDKTVATYNAARAAWLTYHGAGATTSGTDPYFQLLNQNLADLTAALRNLTGKEVKK